MMSTILQLSEFQSNILEFSSSSSESEDDTRKTVIEVIIQFYDENDFKLNSDPTKIDFSSKNTKIISFLSKS